MDCRCTIWPNPKIKVEWFIKLKRRGKLEVIANKKELKKWKLTDWKQRSKKLTWTREKAHMRDDAQIRDNDDGDDDEALISEGESALEFHVTTLSATLVKIIILLSHSHPR
jgi:hypothetical protein